MRWPAIRLSAAVGEMAGIIDVVGISAVGWTPGQTTVKNTWGTRLCDKAEKVMAEQKRKKIRWSSAWGDARELVWAHRRRLALGAVLMLINQAMGLVLPASTKYLIDEVIVKGRTDLLWKIALAAGAATVVQAVTSFSLSQVLGVAAQRAITEMRKKVQAQIARLPVSYFDSTQTGKLISRIMNDAEGIRNLVGTGLVQLAGSFITAVVALCVLFWLNWRLTSITILVLGAVRRRAGFRLHAPPTFVPRARRDYGRAHRPSGRIARRHPHRQSLHRREARGTDLRARRAQAFPQHRQIDDRRFGHDRLFIGRHRRGRRGDDSGRRAFGRDRER